MRRELNVLSGLLATSFALGACQPDNGEVVKKLDAISKKLDDLDKKVAAGGGRPAMPQPPPGPDPTAVYSVPIDGSAFVGPKHAKITIVEAFEFA